MPPFGAGGRDWGLLNTGRIELDWLVTHRFPLEDALNPLETLRTADGPCGKVMLTVRDDK
jgi:threonine dehydrogenase-like Zn-dependent dehydrogenase